MAAWLGTFAQFAPPHDHKARAAFRSELASTAKYVELEVSADRAVAYWIKTHSEATRDLAAVEWEAWTTCGAIADRFALRCPSALRDESVSSRIDQIYISGNRVKIIDLKCTRAKTIQPLSQADYYTLSPQSLFNTLIGMTLFPDAESVSFTIRRLQVVDEGKCATYPIATPIDMIRDTANAVFRAVEIELQEYGQRSDLPTGIATGSCVRCSFRDRCAAGEDSA